MIRLYSNTDKPALIALLQENTPHYFDESELNDFIEYLDYRVEDYFVVEQQGTIIASGGINYFIEDKSARLSWDIVHPDFQGKGIGKKLTLYRIEHIKKNPAMHWVIVRTSQLVYPFYEKVGFVLEKTEKDYWAKGFDLYYMKLALNKLPPITY